jgi:hypothetical protein
MTVLIVVYDKVENNSTGFFFNGYPESACRWRSPGMLRRVAFWLCASVSEEHSVSIFRLQQPRRPRSRSLVTSP